jgi:predicted esterase
LSWYPNSFLAPVGSNQPYLDSALRRLDSLVKDLNGHGFKSPRIGFLGFSQGACLALEYIARHPQRYGAVMGLAGGLIGPPGTPRDYAGSLEGTPVFLGASDPDPHVPFERVRETEAVLSRMGAVVELRRYPGMPHAINDDEMEVCLTFLQGLIARSRVERE